MHSPFSVSRRFLYLSALISVVVSFTAHSQGFLHGRVVSPFGMPISGASISDGASNNTTSDSDGWFTMGNASGGIAPLPGAHGATPVPIDFKGFLVQVNGAGGSVVTLRLFDFLGRSVVGLSKTLPSEGVMKVDLRNQAQLASGIYVLRARVNNRKLAAKAVVSGARIAWQSVAELAPRFGRNTGLASQAAYGAVTISATGYAQRQFTVAEDVALGKEFTLYYTGQGIPNQTITNSQESRSNDIRMPTDISSDYRLTWAGDSRVRCYERADDRDSTEHTVGYNVLILDNGLIEVAVCPELGSRVLSVLDKTETPSRDLFATPFVNNLMSGTKFGNLGGIKPMFPYHENSTGLIDGNGQKKFRSGYFIESHPDGGKSIVMNMRFDYNQLEEDCAFLGKAGDRTLTTVVTIKPGSAALTLRYVADNPNPIRRSDRLWCDAIFPLYPTSWIFPTKWGVQHCASEIWDMTTWDGSDDFSSTHSYFALYPQYGFAGAYYSSAGASHIRAGDPSEAPGMKIYNENRVPELWGSTNTLFEAPEDFVGPWEPNDMTYRFYLARGIGKATFANEQIALRTSGSQFQLTSPWPGIVSVYNYNSTSSPIVTDRRIGPDTVLTGTFSQGVRVVAKDGTVLCNVQLPLQYNDNYSEYAAVKDKADRYGCSDDVSGLDASFGTMCELSDVTTGRGRMSWLASLIRTNSFSSSDDADVLLSMAYAAYNAGGFTAAENYLTKLGSNKPAEAAYLRALMNLENGQSADFSSASVEGNYFRALQAIGQSNSAGAVTYLNTLLSSRPDAIRPRVLRAYLSGNLEDFAEVVKRVPGNLELWTALSHMGVPGAAAKLTGLQLQDQMATTRADDFVTEMEQGQWRHERRYEYQNSWYESVSMPAFPAGLRY